MAISDALSVRQFVWQRNARNREVPARGNGRRWFPVC
jgi:hypothetical protein